MDTQMFEKTWERESGTQPGMILEVVNLYGINIPKQQH